MSLKKKILLSLTTGFVVIQFIQPAHNTSVQVLPIDFITMYQPPQQVQQILRNSCYDCHSNNTNYPWYSVLQPVAWFMADHINEGKKELNFSEFGSLSLRKQVSRLKEISDQIDNEEMPISSYKLIHKNARLSGSEKKLLINWLQAKTDSLTANN